MSGVDLLNPVLPPIELGLLAARRPDGTVAKPTSRPALLSPGDALLLANMPVARRNGRADALLPTDRLAAIPK